MVGMEASIISHPKTWEASGHIENFNDIFVICRFYLMNPNET